MIFEYYAKWEWQPIANMPEGCAQIVLRTNEGITKEICSCDYWWLTDKEKEICDSFRFY